MPAVPATILMSDYMNINVWFSNLKVHLVHYLMVFITLQMYILGGIVYQLLIVVICMR